MAVKKKYRTPLTIEEEYEKALNRRIKGLTVDSFQVTRSVYKKKYRRK